MPPVPRPDCAGASAISQRPRATPSARPSRRKKAIGPLVVSPVKPGPLLCKSRILLPFCFAALLVSPTAALGATAGHRRVPLVRAVTVAEWGKDAYNPRATGPVFRRLHNRYHVNAVTLVVVWMQHDTQSSTIAPGTETVG